MSEQKIEKFAVGHTKSEKKKEKYRREIQKQIDYDELFVASVQPAIAAQHRSIAYKDIYPIYKSAELKETLANCFACSKCKQIFLHLPKNGTGPFTSHKCFKQYHATLKQAEADAAVAKKEAAKAKFRSEAAKKSVKKLLNLSLSSSSGPDEDEKQTLTSSSSEFDTSIDHPKRPPHASVIANTIEKLVTMAVEGKRTTASSIIDDIPIDFNEKSW